MATCLVQPFLAGHLARRAPPRLAAGGSGIRIDNTRRAMIALLAPELLPVIPELGSVGGSGDLTPAAPATTR